MPRTDLYPRLAHACMGKCRKEDADGEVFSADGMPQEDMGAGALPPEPVLPEDEAMLPGDEMPLPPVPVLPEDEAVLPVEEIPLPPVPVLPADETVLPADEMPFPPVLA